MKKLYIRIMVGLVMARHFRCGTEFSGKWKTVDADAATETSYREDQCLEVSEIKPLDFVDPDAAAAEAQATADALASSQVIAPTDPAVRAEAIKVAIAQLDVGNASLWTGNNVPKVEAIIAITGWPVSAAERDVVFNEIVVQGVAE